MPEVDDSENISTVEGELSPDTGDSNSGGQIVGIATGNNRLPADFAVNSVLFSEAEGHVVATQVESWPTTGIHPAVDPIDQHCETQNGRESKTSALEDGVTAGTANLPFVFSSRLSEDSAARSVVEISTETAEPSVTTLQDDFSGHNSFAYRLVCPYLLPGRELIADGSRVTTDDCDKVADVDVDKKIPEGIVSDTGDTNPPLTPDSTPPSVPTTGPPVESLSPLTVEPFSLVKEDVSQPVVEIKETLLSPPIIREDYSAKQTITELPLLTTTTRNSRHPVDSTVVSGVSILNSLTYPMSRLSVGSPSVNSPSPIANGIPLPQYGHCLHDSFVPRLTKTDGGVGRNPRWSYAPEMDRNNVLHNLEKVQGQLNVLQHKYNEISIKYERTLAELDRSRETKHRLECELQEAKADLCTFESDKNLFDHERSLMTQEIQTLNGRLNRAEMEASEIRDQYHRLLEGVSPNAAIAALDNYENVRREKERLRQENEVLDRRYGAAQDELIHYREQTILLQRQLDQELQEKKKVIYQERENQRENMMAAYAQLHKLARDKDVESARVEHLQQQLQETNAEINRLLSLQVQTDEDVKRLRAERNSAKQEYSRVMSERDSILKENEHLTEERTSLCSRLKISEANEKVAQQQLTVLRSELEKGKQERDEFKNSRIGSGSSSTQLCSTCGAGLTHSANLSHVSVGDISGSIGSSGDMAIDINMEELRGQLEALKGDSEKLRQDRDWAMSERERIVAERDSLRLMTDQLRKERDDANTRLGRAIKDADDLKRQREKVELEMREIKDKMESELQALSERSNCDDSNSPSHSRDSAIDADMAEWEIETLVENMSGCSKAEDLGIELGGGRDDPVMGCFYPIYVKNISMGSKFDGVLRVYDCLLQVNNIDVTSMERKSVIDILKNSTQCKMMIKRRRLVGMKLLSVPLDYVDGKDVGLTFEDGVYVSKIRLSSAAAKTGSIAVGDRVVYINNTPVQGKSASHIQDLVREYSSGGLVIAVMKSPPVLSPMTPTFCGFPGPDTPVSKMSSVFSHEGFATEKLPVTISKEVQATSPPSESQRTFSVSSSGSQSPSLQRSSTGSGVIIGSMNSSNGTAKKPPSLIDRFHDKLFVKKTSNIKASASIPPQTPEISKRGLSNRFWPTRPASVYSESPNTHMAIPCEVIPEAEAEALATLEAVLNDHDTLTPRRVEAYNRLQNMKKTQQQQQQTNSADKSASGGTWPKYKANLCLGPEIQTGMSTISPKVSQSSSKPKSSKPSVMSVFSPVASQPPPPYDPSKISSTPNSPLRYNRPIYGDRPAKSANYLNPRPMSYHPSSEIGYNRVSSPLVVEKTNGQVTSVRRSPPKQLAYSQPSQHANFYESQPPIANGGQQRLHHSVEKTLGKSTDSSSGPQIYENYPDIKDFINTAASFQRGEQAKVIRAKQPIPLPQVAVGQPVKVGSGSNRPGYDHNRPSMASPMYSPQEIGDQSGSYDSAMLSRKTASSTTGSSHSVSSSQRDSYAGDNRSIEQISPCVPGVVRQLNIVKGSSSEALGILGIKSHGSGIFITNVAPNSLAAKSGLQRGDQLLSFCGINMRTATEQHARQILGGVGSMDQISINVQYNPNKLRELEGRNFPPKPNLAPHLSSSSEISGNSDSNVDIMNSEPRFVFLRKNSRDWGVHLIGGNAVGIFIDRIDTSNDSNGLRCGDQVLEFNGVDFRRATLEQAREELQRNCDSEATVLVQHNGSLYHRVKRKLPPGGGGDRLYVRALKDRPAPAGSDEMTFHAGNILLVDNTAFNDQAGLWRAWLLDEQGRQHNCGVIPSKTRLEEEFVLKRSGSEMSNDTGSNEGGSRRGTIRRSLKFIRRSSRNQQHQRTSSKDSQETTDMFDEISYYQRVERIDYPKKRPLLILGPLAEYFAERLQEEYPQMFKRCVPETLPATEQGLNDESLSIVNCRRREKLFEVTTLAAVSNIIEQNYHCVLDINPDALERLHRVQIYPVVIFIKFKHSKQIKEVRDPVHDKMVNSKQAKELFEQATRIEAEFHHLFTATIPVTIQNVGAKLICQQIQDTVEHQQKKTLWLLSEDPL